jgi:hypothetical protein
MRDDFLIYEIRVVRWVKRYDIAVAQYIGFSLDGRNMLGMTRLMVVEGRDTTGDTGCTQGVFKKSNGRLDRYRNLNQF